jgi:hypothetical protein
MLMASTMGATASARASAHPCAVASLGGLYDAHHGLLNGIVMPYVLKANRPRLRRILTRCRYLGIKGGFNGFLKWILALRKEIGIPHALKDIGIDTKRLAKWRPWRSRIHPLAAIPFSSRKNNTRRWRKMCGWRSLTQPQFRHIFTLIRLARSYISLSDLWAGRRNANPHRRLKCATTHLKSMARVRPAKANAMSLPVSQAERLPDLAGRASTAVCLNCDTRLKSRHSGCDVPRLGIKPMKTRFSSGWMLAPTGWHAFQQRR